MFAVIFICGNLSLRIAKKKKLDPPKISCRTVGHIPWVPEVFSRVRRGASSDVGCRPTAFSAPRISDIGHRTLNLNCGNFFSIRPVYRYPTNNVKLKIKINEFKYKNFKFILLTTNCNDNNLPIYMTVKVKSDHRSKFSNLSNWKEEA